MKVITISLNEGVIKRIDNQEIKKGEQIYINLDLQNKYKTKAIAVCFESLTKKEYVGYNHRTKQIKIPDDFKISSSIEITLFVNGESGYEQTNVIEIEQR